MVRGPKKHMKRLAAPKSWMLEKLGGVYSCKPSSGPHKQGEFCDFWAFSDHLSYLLLQFCKIQNHLDLHEMHTYFPF